MDKTDFFGTHNFNNTVITKMYCDEFEDKGISYITLCIEGDFDSSEQEYRHYNMYFMRSRSEISADRINAADKPFFKSIKVIRNENGYHAEITINSANGIISFELDCEMFSAWGLHYRGFDYTNVYDTEKYRDWIKKFFYAESEEYFQEEYSVELPDGYSLFVKEYIHRTEHTVHAELNRYELRKGDRCIYEYISTDSHQNPYKNFISHSNGHRYYPFNIDLYGISYIDIDTLDVYNYIPRGYDNNFGAPNGESFIVTDIHYDPLTDLIAYGGCYWSGSGDVMIGDFSEPLQFDPHLVSAHKILDPEYEDFDDTDFDRWGKDGLCVKTDNGKKYIISLETIRKNLRQNGAGISLT
ncbi:MAG: hypothetical protein IJ666_01895 [Ruminococcus sp.]|nr:hypothetical protein [Ruminococcus sp.]